MTVKKTNMPFRVLFERIQEFGKLKRTRHTETNLMMLSDFFNGFPLRSYGPFLIFLIVIISKIDNPSDDV